MQITGGVAGATFVHSEAKWKPAKAFEVNLQPVDSGGYHSYPPVGGPVLVWYDFKSAGFRPAEVRSFVINTDHFLVDLVILTKANLSILLSC